MDGDRRSVNSELWHACAGPRISLPSVGSLVVYFPQGHSEQVAASTLKEVDGHIPNYPNLHSQLVCQLHNVALKADGETDEVYAQMTLQPVNEQEKELFLPPDVGTQNRQPNDFFCKTLTASDTSTHGGFSVPRRAAEKVFPSLDFTKQPPAQELRAKDLHDHVWTFRHIYRGQPKRHLLTTGWSVFVSAKRLVAGDSVLFIRDDKGQLLLGIRRANSRQQTVMPSSVLSSDSMHIGVLAAAAHAAATSSRFQVFYNPRTSPSEFVIPFSKYRKAVHFTQVSVGMRFRMVFETEESTLRRYMGTVTGIGDLDPTRWPGSKWRNLEVGWDESSAAERPRRVSLWEIEPVSTPFLICPSSFALRPKRPPGFLGDEADLEGSMKRCLTWLRGENSGNNNYISPVIQGLGGDSSWIQFQPRAEPAKSEMYDAVTANVLQDMRTLDASKVLQQSSVQQGQFGLMQQRPQSMQQLEMQQQPLHMLWPQQANNALQQILQTQQQLPSLSQQQVLAPTQVQTQLTPTQSMTLPHATPLTVAQPPLPISRTQPSLPSPLSHSLYSSQFQHQQQQQQLLQPPPSQHQQVQNQQLLIQSSPQGQLQQSPQGQSHQSLSQTLSVISQVQPVLPQPHQSSTQSCQHQALTQTQTPSPLTPQSLPFTQQSFSSQGQPSLAQTQQPGSVQAGQMSAQVGEVPSSFSQVAFTRSPSSHNLTSLRQLPAVISESDLGFVSSASTTNYSLPGMLGRTQGIPFSSDDNGQLTNLLRATQNMPQQSQLHQNVFQNHHAVVQPLQSIMQHQHQQLQHTQEALPPAICSLPQIETQVTGSWFGAQCESPMLSNIQIGQSDTSSAITSCSYSLPPEPLDTPLLVSATTGSLQPTSNGTSKEGHCRPINSTVAGSFSSSSGSFTSTTTEGNWVTSGIVTNGVLEEALLPRTCSWSQVPAPVRTFTKVHISGSDVGRSIDLSRLKNYDELRWELARMFHIEGQLEDPPNSFWQLVFRDNVGDILLVGDDPWDQFVSCVRSIKILTRAQVLQMNQEGSEQPSNFQMQQQQSSSSEGCQVWKDV